VYKAEFAEFHARDRKALANKRYKIAEGSLLERHVMEKLRCRWSPDEIRHALTEQERLPIVCNETIYRFIKARRPEFKRYLLNSLPQELPQERLGEERMDPQPTMDRRTSGAR